MSPFAGVALLTSMSALTSSGRSNASAVSQRAGTQLLCSGGSHLAAGTGVDNFIKIGSYNVGLQHKHIYNQASKKQSFFYEFTNSLVTDLRNAFQPHIGQQMLFLCELGSQKKNESIDIALQARVAKMQASGASPPSHLESLRFCDRSTSIREYLHAVLGAAGCEDLALFCHPPYAVIYDTSAVSILASRIVHPLPGNTERWCMIYDCLHVGSALVFTTANNHSPSSDNWDTLTPTKKQSIFNDLLLEVGAVRNAKRPARWIILGDLNTDVSVLKAKASYMWDPSIMPHNDPLSLRVAVTLSKQLEIPLKGDVIISQGIAVHHCESTIGKSVNTGVKAASDNHDMVTLMGFVAIPQCNEGGSGSHPATEQVATDSVEATPPPGLSAYVEQLAYASAISGFSLPPPETAETNQTQAKIDIGASDEGAIVPKVSTLPSGLGAAQQILTDDGGGGSHPATEIVFDANTCYDVKPACKQVTVISTPTARELQEHLHTGHLRPNDFRTISAERASGNSAPAASLQQVDPSSQQICLSNHSASTTTQNTQQDCTKAVPQQSQENVDDFDGAVGLNSGGAHPAGQLPALDGPLSFCFGEFGPQQRDCEADLCIEDITNQTEDAETAEVTQHLLDALFTARQDGHIRSRTDVIQCIAEAQRIRHLYIQQRAVECARWSNSQPAMQYSVPEWVKYLHDRALDRTEHKAADDVWRQEFEMYHMHAGTVEKIKAWREQNTRESKSNARQLARGAFNAYLKEAFGCTQVAAYFLRYPLNAVAQKDALQHLHDAMARWREDPEYQKQVHRSRKRDPAEPAKQEEIATKLQLAKLRSVKRHMERRQRQLNDGRLDKVPPREEAQFSQYKSGQLAAEIDELTRKHGYGQCSSSVEYLAAPSLFDHV